MTLTTTTNRATFNGNGVTTAFSFPYYFLTDASLVVIERVTATGVETVKTLTTHYTVAGAADPAGGTVTMLVAPATGTKLIVYRDPPITQAVVISEGDNLPVEAQIKLPVDKLTMIAQRLSERLDRTVHLTDGSFATFDPTLPAVLTAGASLIINDDGDGFEMGPAAGDIADAAENAASALASYWMRWTFDSTTSMADPGTGDIRFNHATVASVTALAVSSLTYDTGNPDVSDFIATWDDSTNTLKGTIVIRKVGALGTFAVFSVTGSVTDNSTWLQLAVTYVTGAGTFTAADELVVSFSRAGNKGADGAGTVSSVTAADDSIVVAGTAADPTVSRGALTGDVTASAGSKTTTIANDAVTYAKMQNVSATSRILGRKTAAAGDTEECTLSEVLDFIGSAAQGDILYRDSSAWARLGAGTNGQFLKTQGAAANPIWASGGAGALNYVSVGTASNSASIEIAIPTTYEEYIIQLIDVVCATDNVSLTMTTSTDNGSNYAAGTSYSYTGQQSDSAVGGISQIANSGTSSIPVTGAQGQGNGAGKAINGCVHLYNPRGSAAFKFNRSLMVFMENGGETCQCDVSSCTELTTDVDKVKFAYGSGNITSGTFRLYGVSNT